MDSLFISPKTLMNALHQTRREFVVTKHVVTVQILAVMESMVSPVNVPREKLESTAVQVRTLYSDYNDLVNYNDL